MSNVIVGWGYMTELDRMYVTKRTKRRLRIAKEKYGQDMSSLCDEAVVDLLDKHGRRKKAALSEETLGLISEIAEGTDKSPDEVVRMAIDTVRVLFNPELSFGDALRNIPDLARDIFSGEE